MVDRTVGGQLVDYTPVPVAVAKHIAETYDKTHVVVLCFDERINMVHTTTFGLRDDRDKQNAAVLGEHLTLYVGGQLDKRTLFENLVPATAAERELAAACRAALAWVENMRITPGDKRDRLRNQLRAALANTEAP